MNVLYMYILRFNRDRIKSNQITYKYGVAFCLLTEFIRWGVQTPFTRKNAGFYGLNTSSRKKYWTWLCNHHTGRVHELNALQPM